MVQLTAYGRASNLAFMIVVIPAMASCAPGERLAMVLSSFFLAASHCLATVLIDREIRKRSSMRMANPTHEQ